MAHRLPHQMTAPTGTFHQLTATRRQAKTTQPTTEAKSPGSFFCAASSIEKLVCVRVAAFGRQKVPTFR